MTSIFSTQNLQTFLRRKYLRPPGPPSRPPPGPPPGRGGRRSPPVGRSPEGRSPEGRSPPEDCSLATRVSSAIILLRSCRWSWVGRWPDAQGWCRAPAITNDQRRQYLRRHCGRVATGSGSRSRRRSDFLARFLELADLRQALLLFVDAHREELDHRFAHSQAALQFVNQPAAAFEGQQDVHAIMEPAHQVRQTALAHLFDALHLPARTAHD